MKLTNFKDFVSEEKRDKIDPEKKFFEVTDEVAKELLSNMPEWFQNSVDFKEWSMGLDVEQEHNIGPFNVVNGDKEVVAKIAAIHLVEDKEYYTKLKGIKL